MNTRKDINNLIGCASVPIVVIRDGKVVTESLSLLDITEKELNDILILNGYNSYQDLFVVTLTNEKKVNISPYNVEEAITLL